MAVTHARTYAEANEYMRLNTCECEDNAVSVTELSGRVEDESWVYTYAADCEGCGRHHEFEFSFDPVPVESPDRPVYGYGSQPSRLVDAGEWFLVFSRSSQAALDEEQRFGGALPDLPAAERIVEHLGWASAAVAEVQKFIPAGAHGIPDSAVWTERGAAVYAAHRDEFDPATLNGVVDRLNTVLESYFARYGGGRP
jgi:hypothetical protein